MTYRFDPPLLVKGQPDREIRTLDDAAGFLLRHGEEKRPIHNRKGILRKLQAAAGAQQQADAAAAFIGWLQAEELLLGRASGGTHSS